MIQNGIYTIESPTGQHRTFKINTVQKGKLEGKRIVSLLTGPDNNTCYSGFGFVDDNGIAIWHKYRQDSKYDKYSTCLWSLAIEASQSRFYHLGMRLLHEGRCLRCNRRLTTPESIQRGIGPECFSKL